ncbi:GNAT family N-acetyltransferase [Colwellia sp. RSH04]|uniref:GNAT family N-acetyltransferase n=1 Tax=Colwellia sp. RSH04 TaxID=2305464 RepID=UPI000E585E1E|nr:GNAT family N-acetyltransferase [Colwellia sp. RSH04]RHW77386.1 N-acetyltransferase [Colwellia sp. RSH04]
MKDIIETERLIIREFNLFDAKFIVTLLNEPSFIENIGDKKVRTVLDAEQYLQQGPIASYKENGFGLYHVALKENLEPIGMCGILKRDELEFPDIGYSLLPKYWRQGYAKEACISVLAHGQHNFAIKKVLAITSPHNIASHNLLMQLAFQQLCNIDFNGDSTNYYEKELA